MKKKKKGFSLVEAVIAMLLTVPLLALIVLYLHNIEDTVLTGQKIYQIQQKKQEFLDEITTEIKTAATMTISSDGKKLELTINGKKAIYEFTETEENTMFSKTTGSETGEQHTSFVMENLDDGYFEPVGTKAVRIYIKISPTDKIDMTLHRQDFNGGDS